MSSIIIRTSISSSTTRMRRPESNLSIARTPGTGMSIVQIKPVRAVVELHRAFEFLRQTALDHARAEPLS